MGWGIVGEQKGLTLIELMVVVIVIAVISMIAYPNIMKSLQKMEANHVASIITDALKQARAQSHITKQNIIVCPADEFNLCHRQLGKKLLYLRI
ncbi:pilus assembly FimT family protein [Moraxella nonliquefaciens]|uniref:pilus assembly FimT family protein n=1 Tax=Moraxella nonliquefaciens TaxID=478 RepID=UPI0018E1C4ED|nr:prepilin-type N-terminal cleavage/methylation domain-containing protein [Moraxella nonliquefaciens]QQC29408.1 prepilin-type N-terminal cleavage/methylation domain-containing protein [Moraxella nonliquefaciens]